MGHGYVWAAALETCASYGYGMSVVSLGLAALLYWKRRTLGLVIICSSVAALGLLVLSSWLLYRGSLSPERAALDRVDQRIMRIVDRQRRARFLVGQRSGPAVPAAQVPEALQLARRYVDEVEEPGDLAEDLALLRARFRVGDVRRPEPNRHVLTAIFSHLGLLAAAAALLVAAGFLAARVWGSPERAANIGCVGTLLVVVGALLVLTPSGEIHPLALLAAAIPGLPAVVLYLSCRRESARLLELFGSLTLLLAAGLFALSARGYLIFGENEVRQKVGAMERLLPRIRAQARSTGEAIDAVAASADTSTSSGDGPTQLVSPFNDLFVLVGSLEEQLGNTHEEAVTPDEYRDYDPYREEYELFRQEPLRELEPPSPG